MAFTPHHTDAEEDHIIHRVLSMPSSFFVLSSINVTDRVCRQAGLKNAHYSSSDGDYRSPTTTRAVTWRVLCCGEAEI